jgi:hypothetical protein
VDRVYVAGLGIALMCCLALLALYPDRTPFSPLDRGGLGMWEFLQVFHNSSSGVTLLILEGPFTWNLSTYVEEGNELVIAGDWSLINSYLFYTLHVNGVVVSPLTIQWRDYYMNPSVVLLRDQGRIYALPYPNPIIGGKPVLQCGNYTLISTLNYGRGEIVVVSTPYIFTNSFLGLFNNTALLRDLFHGDRARVLLSYQESPLDQARESILGLLKIP